MLICNVTQNEVLILHRKQVENINTGEKEWFLCCSCDPYRRQQWKRTGQYFENPSDIGKFETSIFLYLMPPIM